MERREPDFEDERLRYWRAEKDESHEFEADPTTLDVDLATEEIFESRIYQVRPEFLVDLAIETAADHPELPMAELAFLLLSGVENTEFRMMAKRSKADGRLTYILVGSFAGDRHLVAREDGVDEHVFRMLIDEFEADGFGTGVLTQPTVTDLKQWRSYSEDAQP